MKKIAMMTALTLSAALAACSSEPEQNALTVSNEVYVNADEGLSEGNLSSETPSLGNDAGNFGETNISEAPLGNTAEPALGNAL